MKSTMNANRMKGDVRVFAAQRRVCRYRAIMSPWEHCYKETSASRVAQGSSFKVCDDRFGN